MKEVQSKLSATKFTLVNDSYQSECLISFHLLFTVLNQLLPDAEERENTVQQ